MRNRLPLILIALVLAGVVTMMVYSVIEGEKQKIRKQYQAYMTGLNETEVVVASQDIKRGTILTAEMVSRAKAPQKFVQPYAYTDPVEVVGKETIAPIAQGEQFLKTKVMTPGQGGSMSAKTPPGKRAVTIDTDLIAGVGGFIRPDDRIDILWTFAWRGQGSSEPVTVTLFQNVSVLAVNTAMRSAPGTEEAVAEPRTVTLAMTPLEAELLLYARQQGKLLLSLRPRADKDIEAVPPASFQALMQLISPQAQLQQQEEAPDQATATVEVIRGRAKEVVTVPLKD